MWKKVFKGIPRLSVSHFHFYCGTCTLVGNSKILRASGLGNNINQWTLAFGCVLGRGQDVGRSRVSSEFWQFLLSFPE